MGLLADSVSYSSMIRVAHRSRQVACDHLPQLSMIAGCEPSSLFCDEEFFQQCLDSGFPPQFAETSYSRPSVFVAQMLCKLVPPTAGDALLPAWDWRITHNKSLGGHSLEQVPRRPLPGRWISTSAFEGRQHNDARLGDLRARLSARRYRSCPGA